MKRISILLIIAIWIISACTSNNSFSGSSKIVIDAIGREIVLDGNPSRIIIVGKQAPMLINFLYLFSSTNQKLLAVEKRKQSDGDFLNIVDKNTADKYLLEKGAGAEQISPLKPDLVILKTSMRDTIGYPIEKLSIPVVYVEFENVEQIYRDLRLFAEILNEEKRGEELVSNYMKVFTEINEKFSNDKTTEKPSVLILQANSTDQKYVFSVPAANWLQTDLLEKAGGSAVWKKANQAGGWVDVNMEQISLWDADQIYIINYQGEADKIVANLKEDPIWKNLKSIQNDNIYAFPYDFQSWDQPDPRWILGYAWMAHKINPQLISSSEIESIIINFYQEFFLLGVEQINELIIPKIKIILE